MAKCRSVVATNTLTDSIARAPQSVVANIVRSVGKLLLVVLALWCVHRLMPNADTLSAAWHQWRTGDPTTALMLFVAVGMLFVSVGLPRQTLALVGGYIYGTLAGGALALLVTLAGSALTYLLARHLGRPRLQRRFPEQIARFDGWTAEHVFTKTLTLRLFPVGSNLATNIGAGIGHASPGSFFLASSIGFVPQTAVFALSGTAVGDSSATHLVIAILMLIVSILLGTYTYRSWRQS